MYRLHHRARSGSAAVAQSISSERAFPNLAPAQENCDNDERGHEREKDASARERANLFAGGAALTSMIPSLDLVSAFP